MGRSIIYGVLNWGLGHATRSSVIIRALEAEGFEPIIASDGSAGEWLQQEFPHLPYRSLRPYDIRYSRSKWQFPRLLMQLPKMAQRAHYENQMLKIWVEELKPAGIISDNRLGFWHTDVPSVYLSHQLNPRAGLLSPLAAALHCWYYRNYREIWVPDHPQLNLSGQLSAFPASRKIGILSSLKQEPSQASNKLLIILSGPEPQRGILESKILKQRQWLPANTILVRGTNLPGPRDADYQFKIFDRLGSEQLSNLIHQADLIISRSGYSSIMDYYHLAKRAILIPTPGQSEQEYLAKMHGGSAHFLAVSQKELMLERHIKAAEKLRAPRELKAELPPDLFRLFSR